MRLIDADILLKRIEQSKLYNPHTDIAFKRAHEMEHCHFLYMVIDMPTVEPKQGEWIEHEWAEESEGLLISNYECSECHSWERKASDYCPNCGVKMKGVDDV